MVTKWQERGTCGLPFLKKVLPERIDIYLFGEKSVGVVVSMPEQNAQARQRETGVHVLISQISNKRIAFALWVIRLVTVVLTLGFFIPLWGSQFSLYYKILMANAATSALRLHQRVPNFRFDRGYFIDVVKEDSFHYLCYSLIFIFCAPLTLVTLPVFLFAVSHFASYSLELLDCIGANSIWPARMMISLVELQSANILRLVAFSEILLMPMVVMLTFRGAATLVTPFLFYRFLGQRYSSERNPYSRTIFHELRLSLELLVGKAACPAVIRQRSTIVRYIMNAVSVNSADCLQSKAWTCPQCTLENKEAVSKCDACCSPRVEESKSVSESGGIGASLKRFVEGRLQRESRATIRSVSSSSVPELIVSVEQPKTNEVSGLRDKHWFCDSCTCKNHASSLVCNVCSKPRFGAIDSWVCAYCTLVNAKSATKCRACQHRRNNEALSGQLISPDSAWACAACTYRNNESKSACDMCKSFRGSRSSRPFSGETLKLKFMSIDDLRSVQEKECRKQWTDIVAFSRRSNMCSASSLQYKCAFVDPSFPPAPKSLFYQGEASKKLNTVTQWLRPSEIRSESGFERLSWTVFRSPLPSDISQGILGNCWLLSALAVLAEKEDLIRHVLVTDEYCQEGAYQIRLCISGKWTTILVDDLLPCNKYGQLVYSQAKRRQLWVPLIEKAVAKAHGCYEALISGRALEGLSTLTGAPCESIPLQKRNQSYGSSSAVIQCSGENDEEIIDPNVIWAQLVSCREAGFLMGASCGSGNMTVDPKEFERMGLTPRHAYSILDVKNVDSARLVKMRNPWGRFSWKGAYSDSWSGWTPKLRTQLLPHVASDGVFWIPFDDVMKYFDSVDVCKVKPAWKEVRLEGHLPSRSVSCDYLTCAVVTVVESTEIDITLFQAGQRNSSKSARKLLDICSLILESSNGPRYSSRIGKLVGRSRRQVQLAVGTNIFVGPGVYVIAPVAFNHFNSSGCSSQEKEYPAYVLAIHSMKSLLVEQTRAPPFYHADVLISLCVARAQRYEGRDGMTIYYLTKDWSGLIVMVENRCNDRYMHVCCDCSQSFNVVSSRGDVKTEDTVPPLHRQVILVLSHLEVLQVEVDVAYPKKSRSCTDILCLLLFVCFLGGWVAVGFIALKHGNPDSLVMPTDSRGMICGKDEDVKSKPYLFFFDLTECAKPSVLVTGCPTPQVCVEQCPQKNIFISDYANQKDDLICIPGVNPANSTSEVLRDNCAAYYLQSIHGKDLPFVSVCPNVLSETSGVTFNWDLVGGRCLPDFTFQSLGDVLDNLGLADIGLKPDSFLDAIGFLKLIEEIREVGQRIFEDLRTTWWAILIGLLFGAAVAFVWIVLMRFVAAVMVYASIFGVLGIFSYGLYFSIDKYIELKSHPGSSASLTDIGFTLQLDVYLHLRDTWLTFAVIIGIFLVITLLIFIFLRSRIAIAVELIREGSKAVSAVTATLLYPAFTFLVQIILFALFLGIAVYLASVGKSSFRVVGLDDPSDPNCNQNCNGYSTNSTCLPKTFNCACPNSLTNKPQCIFYSYEDEYGLSKLQIYNIFAFLWTTFFITAFGELVLAGAFATWYWTVDKSKGVPALTLLHSFGRGFRYHLGTVAFGSLIIAIVRGIRLILEYMDRKLKEFKDNAVAKCLMCCCKCFFWCLEKFLRFVNRNAYVITAIHGKSFCPAARTAFFLLMRNLARVVVLDKVTDFLLFIGKMVVVGAVGLAAFAVFSRKVPIDFLATNVPETNYYAVPVIFVTIGTYFVASSFFSVYEMAIDTMFLCFLEDSEKNDGSVEKPYLMSKSLMKVLGKKNHRYEDKE
ncbi:unnamed protein product [Notodromas monacha]|uniref:Calpain-15 n=1 Tax=Notodromas monacha TaxID=399045 RepID=A0A7R9GCT7_9CRUS|nr:unnamed protein product [Notodromas monacha]CAG0917812.1 unnamed protein product [Notodromas monacha]